MDLVLVFEETKRDGMHRRVTPSLVEKATCPIQVVEIVLVFLAPPEANICDFEVTPKMARRVAIGLLVMDRPPLCVRQPVHGIVRMQVLGMLGNEFGGFRPKRWNRLGRVIERNGEAVRLVVVLHITEDVIVHIAEEVHIRLDPPVVLHVRHGRVLIEKSAIPPAHFVIRDLVSILDFVLFQDLDGLLVDIIANPRGGIPVLLGNQF